jgi:MFS family permease
MARRWWILVAVSLAAFMTYLDNNVTNVAIPTIQRSLHLSIAGLEWVVSSYVLVFAGLLLIGGRLADSFGRRRFFFIGTAVFTLASLAAGLAGSGGVLIGARLVQGLGAALVVPTTLAIIIATFSNARERTTAIGIRRSGHTATTATAQRRTPDDSYGPALLFGTSVKRQQPSVPVFDAGPGCK